MDLEGRLQLARSQFGPAWRWQEALARVEDDDDAWIFCPMLLRTVQYVRLCRSRGWDGRVPPRLRLVRAAHELEQRPEQAQRARLLTLSRTGSPEVAQQLRVDEETLACWRQIFFDVISNLNASAWIVAHVIAPEEAARRMDLAGRYRYAYFGRSTEAAEDPGSARPQQPADHRPRDERLWRALAIRTEQALNMALSTPATAQKVIQSFLSLHQLELRIEREAARRQQAEAVAIRRHEIDMAALALRKAKSEEETARLQFRQRADGRYSPFEYEAASGENWEQRSA